MKHNTHLRVFDFSLVNDQAHSLPFNAGDWFFKHHKATHLRVAVLLFLELAYRGRRVRYLLLLYTDEKVYSKLYMKLAVFINSRFQVKFCKNIFLLLNSIEVNLRYTLSSLS